MAQPVSGGRLSGVSGTVVSVEQLAVGEEGSQSKSLRSLKQGIKSSSRVSASSRFKLECLIDSSMLAWLWWTVESGVCGAIPELFGGAACSGSVFVCSGLGARDRARSTVDEGSSNAPSSRMYLRVGGSLKHLA